MNVRSLIELRATLKPSSSGGSDGLGDLAERLAQLVRLPDVVSNTISSQ